MALTPRQERFVAEYLIDLNATQAAIRAGYSDSTAKQQGSRLLSKADVRAAVSSGQIATLEKVAGSAEWIVEQAVRVVRYALDDGDSRDLRAAVPALTLLARRHPEFSDKHDISVSERSETLLMVASMSPDELRKLAAGADADA